MSCPGRLFSEHWIFNKKKKLTQKFYEKIVKESFRDLEVLHSCQMNQERYDWSVRRWHMQITRLINTKKVENHDVTYRFVWKSGETRKIITHRSSWHDRHKTPPTRFLFFFFFLIYQSVEKKKGKEQKKKERVSQSLGQVCPPRAVGRRAGARSACGWCDTRPARQVTMRCVCGSGGIRRGESGEFFRRRQF